MDNKTILIIDDDNTIIQLACAVLESHEFITIAVQSGKEGIEKALNEKPDAILLDKEMPEMNGDEVLTALKENPETQNIPVIMLTGENNISQVAKSLENGALDYVVKPFNNDNLILRLNRIIDAQ